MPTKMTTAEREPKLPLNELTAISILDGRNRQDVAQLAPYVSEFNVIKTRIEVESKYLIALSRTGVIHPLTKEEKNKLESFSTNISLGQARKIKKIESRTEHDVKAMEKSLRTMLEGTSLEDVIEKVHIGLTSEDINNITYRLILKRVTQDIFVPTLDAFVDELIKVAKVTKSIPMLARTHGQAAVPTTLGKEIIVFASRLNGEIRELETRQLSGKLTGAVGNLNALHEAYPNVDWIEFSKKFVSSFGLEPNLTTTQINPYEDIIAIIQNYQRINGIFLDFDQDMWRYISDDWFVQELKEGEVGSSTMPQKVNPIRFENSEGNLGKANALFEFMVRTLPVSRLQRHLSDSTIIRDMGVPLGYSLLSYKNSTAGFLRVRPNEAEIIDALNRDWAILSEAAQTIMRKSGVKDPYSLMAKLTRGKHIGKDEWIHLIEQLPLSDTEKQSLRNLTPETYIGEAVKLTELAINKIINSRK